MQQTTITSASRRFIAIVAVGALGAGALTADFAARSTAAVAQDQQTRIAPPPGAPASFADVVEQVKGAVVSINVTAGGTQTTSNRGNRGTPVIPGIPENSPFYEFFRRFGERNGGGNPVIPRRRMAQGSGFIISNDGFVVTNNHVIDKATEISVSIDESQEYTAKLVGTDPRTDLALLKIDGDKTDFNFVSFANRNVNTRVGDWVLAVGNPFGLGGTVTAGIVSAKARAIGSGPYDFLQIDAAVNRGNSGGPTFDLNGNVIGVNTAIYSPGSSGGNVGIAFAVPAGLAARVINELRNSGQVSRGWLGVQIQTITDDIGDSLGMNDAHGALISQLTEDGPASNSELQVGDAIIAVNGSKVENSRDLARKIADLSPGAVAAITVLRDGSEREIDVELGTFPGASTEVASLTPEPQNEDEPREMASLGLTLAPKSAEGADGVAIVKVAPDSEAAEKGLREGDVILEVAGREVTTAKDVADGV
ncbi:MAG: trypsin-like peptidase domain-containing protein, partial [Pseudomonadota bacterium]